MYDVPPVDSPYDEDLVQTQEDSQPSTQPLSQLEDSKANEELWGYLNPCLSQTLQRINLFKEAPEVTVGRNAANNVIFPGFKISNYHAVIRWNGLENAESVVTIEDLSSNGTFINGEKIGKGQQRILKDGNEIAFGISMTSREANGLYDYRFVFRDLVSGVKKRPLYESYDMSIELGKGSFATVYRALHRSSGEWVAVKVIHETKRHGPQPTTPSEAARIGSSLPSSREINIMQTLRHPNICMLREVFWNTNGSIDLVLELVEGGDLLDFILTHNGLSEDMSKHITYQLCQALSYIHAKGITHRDLKPENVLLTRDNPPIVKVADFGLAKIVDSMTMLRTMCGTPSYLAPEVVSQQNSSGYDSLVDSWSVGVILFSMLTNTNPFIETSAEDIRTRIRERTIAWDQLEQLKYGNSQTGYYGLSSEVLTFVRALLEDDPRKRMRLGDALFHPWLEEFSLSIPIDYPEIDGSGNGNGSLSEDVSMRTADHLSFSLPSETDAVSQGFEHLKLNGSGSSRTALPAANGQADVPNAGAEGRVTPGHTPPAPELTPSKRGGLQRRSEVLQHAVDTGGQLVEPSWEMVNYASSQEEPAPSASGSGSSVPTTNGSGSGSDAALMNGNGKGPNKRVHSELTPLPEEDAAAPSDASSPLSNLSDSPPAPTRKKGRSASASESAAATTPGKKRAGRPPTSARKVKAKTDDEPPAGTRRSTRARR
ncbi:kinase-like domain-containing protein [Mycena latifolia]|nr:kinase-like domain-containing protein [Mycena latifolia]